MFRFGSACVLVSISCSLAVPTNGPLVEISTGKLNGISISSSSGKLVDAYLGVPFGQAPVKGLRFRPPLPAKSWNGILEVKAQPNTCYQKLIPLSKFIPALKPFLPKTSMSEDCLKLNVWTPNVKAARPMPVMFWIYGGGFSRGTVAYDVLDPRNLVAEEDVVVVMANYRVASLGFLYLDDPGAPGNAGLLDQVLALKWVRDNIKYFGGDPELVTIFGQSAGGASVVYHTISPLSKGLYKRAIVQSGAPHTEYGFGTTEEIKKHSWTLTRGLSCPGNIEEALDCLRSKEPEDIILAEPQGPYDHVYTFKPIKDKNMVMDHPLELMKANGLNTKEILLGSNRDEGGIFLLALLPLAFRFSETLNVVEDDVKELGSLLQLGKSAEEVARLLYTDTSKPMDWKIAANVALQSVSDFLFTCPLNDVAQYSALAGGKVFKYFFTHRSSNSLWPSWAGTVHAEEIAYVFGVPLENKNGFNQDERDLSRRIMRLWVNFARNGNPNINVKGEKTDKEWPQYTPENKEYFVIAPNTTAVGLHMREKMCLFWTKTRPILEAIERNARSSTS